MTQINPPLDPNDWTDEQWIEWLNAEDADQEATEQIQAGPMNRIVRSSGGQAMGSAMLALWNIYYGKSNNDEAVQVAETPDNPEDSFGKLVLGDSDAEDPKFILKPSAVVKDFRVLKLDISKAKEVATVYHRAFIETYKDLVDDRILQQVTFEFSLNKWSELLKYQSLPTNGPLGLFCADELCGIVSIGKSQDDIEERTGEISGFYVDKNYQGRGGGGLLILYALGQLKAAGYQSAILWVLENNLKARGFYERYGFVLEDAIRERSWQELVTKEVKYLYRFD